MSLAVQFYSEMLFFVFFFFFFSSFQKMKLLFVMYWVCVVIMAVESTVETVKDWLELRLAQ